MMSLVAYGSSGESENESDNEMELASPPKQNELSPTLHQVNDGQVTVSSFVAKVAPSDSKSDLHSKLPAPKTASIEEIEEKDSGELLRLSSKLPAPKTLTAPSLLESSIVLSKGKNKTKMGTVKIMIPSLSDFPEDEEEPKARKKIQPSAKGSGLFALLPPPKQAPVKQANRSLVPNVLTRKPTPVPVPTPVKKSKPSVQSVKRKHQDSDPESDGDGEGIDFFSLNKEDKLPDIPMAEVPPVASTSEYQSYGGTELEAFQDPSSSHQQTDYQYQYGQPEAAVAPPQADSGQDFINFNGGEDLQLDDEALKKLCGRQFKGRNREEIQILDVSGDSIMPDQREWLTKQLTEEQPRSSSKSKLFGPSSQQKRKHQITYLAHVAKENELELKNQWANNRQTRKQTQSKYGF